MLPAPRMPARTVTWSGYAAVTVEAHRPTLGVTEGSSRGPGRVAESEAGGIRARDACTGAGMRRREGVLMAAVVSGSPEGPGRLVFASRLVGIGGGRPVSP